MRPSNPHPGTFEHHEYSREEGYKTVEGGYVHAEYPKVVGYEADGVTAIIAKDAEDEARLKANAEAE